MIITTLNKILKRNPCGQEIDSGHGWDKLLEFLDKDGPDDEELSLLTILESNGLLDAIWALRATTGYDREIRLFACKCVCNMLCFFDLKFPDATKPLIPIETAALYAEDMAVEVKTGAAARAAYGIANAAYDVAYASLRVSYAVAARRQQKEEFIKLCKEGRGYEK